jgi:antitoxin YefM
MVRLPDMKSIPSAMAASAARSNFYKIIEEAGENMRQFTITHRGKPPVILMSVEEYEGWLETLDIISDRKLVTQIKHARQDIKTGKGTPWEKVR